MYLNLGEKSLCRTCRQYPRHMEEFENVREASLSLSCPEVAKLLLSRKEKQKGVSMSEIVREAVYGIVKQANIEE